MSAYSTWPADDFEVWESLQLFDFPSGSKPPATRSLETGFPLTATLLGARKRGESVRVDTVGGRTWTVYPRAVGRNWFSGQTDTPERGVVISLDAVVELRCTCPPDVDAAPVAVSLSRAIAVTAKRTRTVRVTTTTNSREGVIRELGADYVTITRGSLDGRHSVAAISFSHLVAVEFLEPGDIF